MLMDENLAMAILGITLDQAEAGSDLDEAQPFDAEPGPLEDDQIIDDAIDDPRPFEERLLSGEPVAIMDREEILFRLNYWNGQLVAWERRWLAAFSSRIAPDIVPAMLYISIASGCIMKICNIPGAFDRFDFSLKALALTTFLGYAVYREPHHRRYMTHRLTWIRVIGLALGWSCVLLRPVSNYFGAISIISYAYVSIRSTGGPIQDPGFLVPGCNSNIILVLVHVRNDTFPGGPFLRLERRNLSHARYRHEDNHATQYCQHLVMPLMDDSHYNILNIGF